MPQPPLLCEEGNALRLNFVILSDCHFGRSPPRTYRVAKSFEFVIRAGGGVDRKLPHNGQPSVIGGQKEGSYVTRVEDRIIGRSGPALRHGCLTGVECSAKGRRNEAAGFQRQRSQIDRRVLHASSRRIGTGLTGSIRVSPWGRTITCRRIARTDATRKGFETPSGKAGVAAHSDHRGLCTIHTRAACCAASQD